VFVNASARTVSFDAESWDEGISVCDETLRLDSSSGGRVIRAPFDGVVQIDSHGMAIVTNCASSTIID
jgi:hypothetical protein